MATQDAILRLLLDNQQLLAALANTARQWHVTMRRMETSSSESEVRELSDRVRLLEAELQRLGTEAAQSIGELEKAARRSKGPLGDLGDVVRRFRGLLAAAGFGLGARELIQFAKSSVEASIRLEAFRAQLNASTNTVAESNKLFQFAGDQAERLGLSYAALVEGTARFSAATKESSLTLEEREDILKNVFESARVLNLSEQRLQNTLLAVEQIVSKSTVSMEELRRQLGDNLPGAVAVLAKEYGVTQEELVKLIETNRVFSDEAVKALFATGRGFSAIFGSAVPEAIETTAAKLGRLEKQLFDFKIAFAEGFGDEFADAVVKIGDILRDLEPAARTAGSAISLLVSDLSDDAEQIVFLIDKARKAWKAFTDTPEGRVLVLALQAIAKYSQESSSGIVLLSDNLEKLGTLGPEAAARTVAGLGTLAEEAHRVDAALSAAADAAELANLETATRLLVDAFNEAARAGELSGEQSELLSAIVKELIKRYEEAGDEIPESLRRIAVESGIALKETRTAAEQVSDALDEARQSAKKLADQFSGDRSKIEAATESLLDLASSLDLNRLTNSQLEALKKKLDEVVEGWELLGERAPLAVQEIQDKLDDSGVDLKLEEIELAVRELLDGLALFKDVDLEILSDEQIEAAKEAIQELLDEFGRYARDVPEDVQAVADKLGVTTSIVEKELEKQTKAAEKAAKEQKKHFKDIQKSIKDIADEFIKLSETLEGESSTEVEKLQQKLEELQDQEFNLDIGEGEEFEKIRQQIEETREELQKAKESQEEVGQAGSDMAEQIDDAIRSMIEKIGPAFGDLEFSGQQAIQSILQRLQDLGQTGGVTSDDLASSVRQIITEFEAAGLPVDDLRTALSELQTGTFDIESAFGALRKELGQSEDSLEGVRRKTEEIRKENVELAKEVGKQKVLLEEIATTYKSTFAIVAEQQKIGHGWWLKINEECRKHKECLGG